MLKIKDNVDLKELKKFGLNYTIGEDWHRSNDNIFVSLGDNQELNIECDDCYFNKDINECIEWLYDLIKADLVEKVDD
jgi:hypothetical protein